MLFDTENVNNNVNKPKRKRGRRGGLLVRSRNKFNRTPLPSLILSNVNRLYNKTDELFTRIETQNEFKLCQVFCFTETWLKNDYPDNLMTPPGFLSYRCDRDLRATGKKDGGGVCFLINKEWCKNVKILTKISTPNFELLSIKCRPFYLPREFSSITLTGVYIHPRANMSDALHDVSVIISSIENKDPDTASIVLGDFNQSTLRSVLPDYHQLVTCPTRLSNILDHCYCKISQSYRSFQRSGLGNSDHSVIVLVPKYIQESKKSKPTTSVVTVWSQSSMCTLQNCFDITDWRVFRDLWTDLDEFTTTVSAYIRFCCNVCLPTKTVTSYPNNKQWCNKPIRNKIVAKDRAYRFRSTDPEKYRAAKKDLDMAIYNSKTIYKHKLEDIFNSGDSKKLWSNMNLITQYKGTKKSADSDDVQTKFDLNYLNFVNLN